MNEVVESYCTTKAIRAIPGYIAQVEIARLFLAMLIVLECYAWGKDRGNFGDGQIVRHTIH